MNTPTRARLGLAYLAQGSLRLDELLKQRAEGLTQIEHEGVDIQLPALLKLIDDKFYRKKEKKKK